MKRSYIEGIPQKPAIGHHVWAFQGLMFLTTRISRRFMMVYDRFNRVFKPTYIGSYK